MIRAIAIDDEPLALEVIKSHAAKVPFLEVLAYFTDALKAIEYMASHPADLLFLDIKMPDISGIELFESLQQKPMVVFTTAYTEHAVQSYELNAVDYLLKPFPFTRFLKACHKANDLLQARQNHKPAPADSIFIKAGYEQVKITYSDILYLESGGNYMSFVLANGKSILSRLTITDALALLPPQQFIRVHRSYIVNKNKVDRAERHQLHLSGRVVPLGNSFNTELLTGKN
ncbi:response regulator transcription factor [Inquilinus sp. KBS0705]|nr:response regulator transcription factor [Inquilinus sp. KBS0705]